VLLCKRKNTFVTPILKEGVAKKGGTKGAPGFLTTFVEKDGVNR